MRCEGIPSGPCPQLYPINIKLRQGDLVLCNSCKEVRFGCNNNNGSTTKDTTQNLPTNGGYNAMPLIVNLDKTACLFNTPECPQQSADSTPNASITLTSTDPAASDITILDPLLSYISYGLSCGSRANVKNAILGFFTYEEIVDAKNTLFDKCSQYKDVIGEPHRRKDSVARSEIEAHLIDILNAICALDKKAKMPTFAVSFMSFGQIPKSPPEQLNNISLVDRLNRLEDTQDEIKIILDRTVAENYAVKEELKFLQNNRSTYARVVSSPAKQAAHVQPSTVSMPYQDKVPSIPAISIDQDKASSLPASTAKHQISRGSSSRGRGAPSSSLHGETHQVNHLKFPEHHRSAQSLNSGLSDTHDGFQIPKYHQKKKNSFLTGKKTAPGIRCAPEPSRYLFIYRVHSDTSESDMKNFIESQDINVRSFSCTSHQEAKYKSFKLEVSVNDFNNLFDDELWPAGVRIRKFIPPRMPREAVSQEQWAS